MKVLSTLISASLIASSLVASTAPEAPAKAPQPKVAVIKAPGAISGISTVTATATVQKIDKKTRVITLKKETGEIVDITATEEVRNFAQIKVGDIVTTKLTNTLDIRLVKDGSNEVGHAVQETSSRAKLGDKPQGTVTRTMAARAKVTKIDPKTQTITLEGQNQTLDVAIKDPEQFKLIAVGNMIDMVTTQTLAISVAAAPKKK
jgi:Cu/Ag efflux protein CusF